eukprot:7435806-Pyramimonas_sp.AAC.1
MQGSHWVRAVRWPLTCSWLVSASTGDQEGSVRSRFEFHARTILGMRSGGPWPAPAWCQSPLVTVWVPWGLATLPSSSVLGLRHVWLCAPVGCSLLHGLRFPPVPPGVHTRGSAVCSP